MSEITIGNALAVAVTGYAVVFVGLILLMIVVLLMGKIMARTVVKSTEEETVVTEALPVKAAAPGTAGELKLYDTDPKDAAMIMAIVADQLGKPINELRFKSIREVRE